MKKLQYVSPQIMSEITIPNIMEGAPASAPAKGTDTGGTSVPTGTVPGAPKIV